MSVALPPHSLHFENRHVFSHRFLHNFSRRSSRRPPRRSSSSTVVVVVVVVVVAEEEVVVIIVVEVLIVAAACHTNDVIHWDLGNRRKGTGDRQEAFKAMF